jgi:succinate-semialdehyde dehydrogenase/glutarate-semialdehyde dehydrogenase
MTAQYQLFIGGEFVPPASGRFFAVEDPASGEVVAHVAEGSPEDVEQAAQVASDAFRSWRWTAVHERAACLQRIAAALREQHEAFAQTLTREVGKPLEAARREVLGCADTLEYFAAEALRLHGEVWPSPSPTRERVLVVREPVGVVALIAPFNYPMTLLTVKLAPALAAGCTVVAKPAEETPITALMLAALCHEAGLPAGVFNVVTGFGEVGQALVDHPLVRKVSFTGGVETGRRVAARAAERMKRPLLELGGQCPALVAADADWEAMIPSLAWHSFENAGQFCYRVNRIFVEEPIYEDFTRAFAAAAEAIPVGPRWDTNARIGPLRTRAGYEKVVQHVEDALSKGARLLTGGQRLKGPPYEHGYFFPPTVLADTHPAMRVMREETFGPVVGIMPVASLEEAVELANASAYGLAAYVFCRDWARAWQSAEALEVGSVWVNTVHHSYRYCPFGGVKGSGMGREKSRYGLEEYTELKTIYLGVGRP